MSYARLALAVLKGFVIIGVVGLCLLYVRAKYIDELRVMPWGLFAILMGGCHRRRIRTGNEDLHGGN